MSYRSASRPRSRRRIIMCRCCSRRGATRPTAGADLGDYPVLDRSGSRWYRLLRQAGVLVVLVSVPISIGPGSFWNRAAAATRTDVVNETRDQSVFTDVKVFELREYNFVWMGVERES